MSTGKDLVAEAVILSGADAILSNADVSGLTFENTESHRAQRGKIMRTGLQ